MKLDDLAYHQSGGNRQFEESQSAGPHAPVQLPQFEPGRDRNVHASTLFFAAWAAHSAPHEPPDAIPLCQCERIRLAIAALDQIIQHTPYKSNNIVQLVLTGLKAIFRVKG